MSEAADAETSSNTPTTTASTSASTSTSTSASSKPRVRLVQCGNIQGPLGGSTTRPTGRAGKAHLEWACLPTGQWVQVHTSTVVGLDNRERDKNRVESALGLSEFGDSATEFYSVRCGGLPIGLGYDRIVYGDHGPYVEFSSHQICWSTFPTFLKKPEMSYYDEYYTVDGSTMLYAQKRSVANKPNPPGGQWSAQNNRPEGYANYLIGKFYLSAEPDCISVKAGAGVRRKKRGGRAKGKGGQGTQGEEGGGEGEAVEEEVEEQGKANGYAYTPQVEGCSWSADAAWWSSADGSWQDAYWWGSDAPWPDNSYGKVLPNGLWIPPAEVEASKAVTKSDEKPSEAS
eukprot:TRINITY_DN16951_c2_g1_i1.p1 TRINITY_DN16951_c2_g1~~TRINITY_DN16951_c2_g1_i1.p1  ORF type:complete len:374 (+),score=41.08 TRINITY_DN16951_c2_g1_i1:96-1124(+)